MAYIFLIKIGRRREREKGLIHRLCIRFVEFLDLGPENGELEGLLLELFQFEDQWSMEADEAIRWLRDFQI
jgi:hypothetical protein